MSRICDAETSVGETQIYASHWFLVNYNDAVDGMYTHILFDDEFETKTMRGYFTSSKLDVGLLSHVLFYLMQYNKARSNSAYTALETINNVFLAGLEMVSKEIGNELAEKTSALLRRQYREKSENTKSRYTSASYPVFIKAEKSESLFDIEEMITDLSNETQWTAQRIINEAFVRGLRELVRKKCHVSCESFETSIEDMQGDEPVWIYGLVDPRDGKVYYIGKSKQPLVRLGQHLKDENNEYKLAWLNSLKDEGLKPGIRFLDCVSESEAGAIEADYIKVKSAEGWPLTNIRSI